MRRRRCKGEGWRVEGWRVWVGGVWRRSFSDGFCFLGDVESKVVEREVGEEVLNVWRTKRGYEIIIWEWETE